MFLRVGIVAGRSTRSLACMANVPPEDLDEEPPEWWKQLTPEQQAFVRLLTGSDGRPNPSLEEVGRIFDETRSRIREIEQRALGKPRDNGSSKQ